MLMGEKRAPASHDIASVDLDQSACPASVLVYAVRMAEKTADRLQADEKTNGANVSGVLASCAASS